MPNFEVNRIGKFEKSFGTQMTQIRQIYTDTYTPPVETRHATSLQQTRHDLSVQTRHATSPREYANIPEYCYSATMDEIAKKDFSLVPSKYIEFVNRDENVDFDEKMQALQSEFAELLKAEVASKNDLLTVFKELGYEIKL